MRHTKLTVCVAVLLGLLLHSTAAAASPDDRDGGSAVPDPTQMEGFPDLPEEKGALLLQEFRATYSDLGGWKKRASAIRESIMEGAGLKPPPEKPPLEPLIHSRREHEGYSVANVAFQSAEGFYVTGNLYRPLERNGKVPAILCPHGHWDEGRMRPAMQARCAMLARMGAVVFAWDMVGFGDSTQVEHRNPHALSAQLWNGIRAVDFVQSLEGVDDSRIGATGASGGATQTFLLTAVEDRIAATAPVVQVSSHFFGGCVGESGKPIHSSPGTNNVEIAALAAPRPQLIISDGSDWTATFPLVGYPYVKDVYRLYDAGPQVGNTHFYEGQHNYGYCKRIEVYKFFARALDLERHPKLEMGGETVPEQVAIEPKQKLRVWTDEHPMPDDALQGHEALARALGLRRRVE